VRVTLLGPQRNPTLDSVVAAQRVEGQIATVTAGWQEREPDDQELSKLLGAQDVNLQLYRRWLDVQERDPEFAAGERQVRRLADELQEIYLLRLDHALAAVRELQRRSGVGRLRAEAVTAALAAVRELDAAHLRRVGQLHGEFYQAWQPHARPVIAGHRDEIARLLAGAAALVIAGGHVGVLAATLHLFNIAAALNSPVIAWSAGAMALTDRIVLFYDRAPQGPGHPEVYGAGLSLLRDVVLLPHARARMMLDDGPRMALFARRFAPARCLLLEAGSQVETSSDGGYPPGTLVLDQDGRVSALEAA
jgi:hypothetical protein